MVFAMDFDGFCHGFAWLLPWNWMVFAMDLDGFCHGFMVFALIGIRRRTRRRTRRPRRTRKRARRRVKRRRKRGLFLVLVYTIVRVCCRFV